MLTKLAINIILISFLAPLGLVDENLISKQNYNEEIIIEAPEKINENSLGLKVTAQSAVVMDKASGAVLFQKGGDKPQPIASLTKLMTALVFLDEKVDWQKIMTVSSEDYREGGRLYVSSNETLTVKDLFYSSLVGSANNATMTLVRATGLSEEEFVNKMNKKSQTLGFSKTRFIEPTGLDERNISTAYEIAKLAAHAFNQKDIQKAVSTQLYTFYTINTQKVHNIKNTNKLFDNFINDQPYKITGSKTGFIQEAKHCLITEVEKEGVGQVIAVVLGSEADSDRFLEVKGLIYWAFENYQFN